MTDAEIIKALGCCAEPKQEGCSHCLIADKCISGEINICDCVLDLINRQRAEIERLKTFIEKDQGLILKLTNVPKDQYDNKIKAEAIKEFAERVKQEINFPLAVWKVFDDLIEEMVGDLNGNAKKTDNDNM